MSKFVTAFPLLALVFSINWAHATTKYSPITFSSGDEHVTLLELYSSQGCSSCPPAQNWVNNLETSELLWTKVIPVVYHVDYWDYLGWRDPFASGKWSKRQRSHKWQGNIRSVYTPGFVVDGSEWRGWFQRQALKTSDTKSGSLTVTVEMGIVTAEYTNGDFNETHSLKLNMAQLAMNEITPVRRGENRNKHLVESFIVLNQRLINAEKVNDETHKFKFASDLEIHEKTKAVAFWVTDNFSLSPIQATGGWLPVVN